MILAYFFDVSAVDSVKRKFTSFVMSQLYHVLPLPHRAVVVIVAVLVVLTYFLN